MRLGLLRPVVAVCRQVLAGEWREVSQEGRQHAPQPWAMFESGEAFWQTEDEFEAVVKRPEAYRPHELIKEHLDDLSEKDQRLLYEQLKRQFEEAKPSGR